ARHWPFIHHILCARGAVISPTLTINSRRYHAQAPSRPPDRGQPSQLRHHYPRHRRTPAEGIGAVFGERYGRRGTQSASDNSAIIPAHHHDGGARLAGAAVGEVRLGAVGAGVLDPNEECAVVGREGDAGDLAAIGAGGEAADLAGCGIGTEHLVVAHALVFTAVAEVAVGFDPQPAVGVEGEAVGAVEHVVGSDVVAAGV